ncbi:DEAD/DEAH box helicase [Serinicoccus marinus]|uniref:DEAD/DEAH box helicase n=1 Tax=Serinicoccus marinus TaxID=247333 RepID=UPI0024930F19|nr:DEAD/DEAH box helicase [Serinicoccus marinus]
MDLPPADVAVTAAEQVFDSLVTADCPALLATVEDAPILQQRWGLAAGEELLQESLEHEEGGEPYLAVDRYPPLRNSLDVEYHELLVRPCSRLDILTSTPRGQVSRPLTERLDGQLLYTTAVQDRDVLLAIGRALDVRIVPDRVLSQMEEQRRNKLRLRIAQTDDIRDKIALAFGREELARIVPVAALAGLRAETGEDPTDRQLADLALSVDGYNVLKIHAGSLRKQGLEPPEQWAGRRHAREWVRSLGFPVEYAGFPSSTWDAELLIDGPAALGALHPYQRAVAQRIRELLDPSSESRRGLVALPTGAGKTRAVAQALVEVMAERTGDFRVVWIAETEELCEQAVQTWAHVWRAEGKPLERLSVSRLWGERESEERDGKHVVVASTAKLHAIRRRGETNLPRDYAWLVGPHIIVVDEAHRSVGTQYTQVLAALGGTSRVAEMSTPLLGLTATPFRSWNDRETEVLAGRYHRNRLDDGVFSDDDPHTHLQRMGVLANVRHQLLEGADLTLSDTELKASADFKNSIPASVEKRLGDDEGRTTRIVRSLLSLPPGHRVLVFSTSVDNSRTIAALLSYHGVRARSVSAKTEPNERRRYIEDFKEGRVRVLTNYNVFTEGFDVPSVDAVYITRPTYSPNVYQQMIGRGLRGPLNGGKDEVLVVNVADNITNFGEKLAFHHFEHLWEGNNR